MWQLKKNKNVPIYRSIMEMIVQKIQTGELLPGEKSLRNVNWQNTCLSIVQPLFMH